MGGAATSNSGFDLALCWINVPENDHTIAELHGTTDIPIPTAGVRDLTGKIAVVGFPGEHEGEKWGMAAEIPSDKRKDWTFFPGDKQKEILTYDFIDTSPGQSGSPIMHLGKESCEIIVEGVKYTRKNGALLLLKLSLNGLWSVWEAPGRLI